MKCKYCDAERDTTPGGIEMWECGTHVSFCDGVTIQSGLCQKNELARYRAMFPVPPWSTDAITSGTCESLNMHRSDDGYSYSIVDYVYVHQTMDDTWRVSFRGYTDRGMTAGQLACLVAARRASE